MKAGTFDPYPSHSADQYQERTKRDTSPSGKREGMKVFMPPAGPKSAPINSVLHQNIAR